MKLSNITQDAITGWENVRYDETRNGRYLSFVNKPTKAQEAKLSQLFLAFGGVEDKKFKYEFTYDPRWVLGEALKYGYYNNPHLNFAFLPKQLERAMFENLIIPSNARILFPYFGYGYTHSKFDSITEYDAQNALNRTDSNVSGLYDGALFRSSFGNVKNAHIMFTSLLPLLKENAVVSCIVDALWLTTPSFDKMLWSNFHNISRVVIPHPTWIPLYGNNMVKAVFIHMKKGMS